jgi:peptidyl-tRNA hydrolase ICT1
MSNAALLSMYNRHWNFTKLAMQRHILQRLFTSTRPSLSISQHARAFALKRGPADYSDEDLAAARKWLADLNPDTIPRSLSEITFSRSSGPGGQNVNKYASRENQSYTSFD